MLIIFLNVYRIMYLHWIAGGQTINEDSEEHGMGSPLKKGAG